VSTLRTTFLADIADPTPQRYTHNLEAYSLYLKGSLLLEQAQSGGRAGGDFLLQAGDRLRFRIRARVLRALGLVRAQVDYRSVPVTEGYRLAREYALKALDLDDTLPEAHTSARLGAARIRLELPGAMREYARALDLNPGFATARHWYSFVLLVNGQAEQAMMEALTALELDPSSLSVRRGVGWISYYTAATSRRCTILRRAVAMNPTSEDTYRVMGWCSRNRGPTPRRSVRSARRSPSHPTCRTRPRAWPTCWP